MMVTGNIASGTLFVSEVPLLEKEFTNDPVAPGNSVDLEFTITNSSSVNPMTNISFYRRADHFSWVPRLI